MSEWISTKERLLELGEDVLVIDAPARDIAGQVLNLPRGYDVRYLHKDRPNKWYPGGRDLITFSHWMPLPAPPATEEELHRLKTGRQYD